MKIQRVFIVLTIVNFGILIFLLAEMKQVEAQKDSQMLRGRGLEIVDDHGKVRAQIIITPPVTMPDGQKYAESTLLRLIDPNGRPGVKIGTSVDGTGVSLAGDSDRRDWSGIQILANSSGSTVKLTNRDGREQLIKP